MKIRRLKIKNYKVFDDVEFDFTDKDGNTLDTIVLAGVNGSGKTTVLELIINLFNGSLFTKRWSDEHTNIEIIVDIEFTENSLWAYASVLQEDNDVYGMLYDKIKKHKNYLTLIFSKNNNQEIKLLFSAIESFGFATENRIFFFPNLNFDTQRISPFILILDLLKDKNQMQEIALKTIRNIVFENKDKPPRQSIEEGINRLTRVLKGVELNTKLIDLSSEELIFKSKSGARIKFEDLSSGEKRMYFRGIYLSQYYFSNSMILIDEPETSIHPSWQQKMIQLYQNVGENNQVFLATHSPHIIASVKPENLFLLAVNEENRKVEVINMAKADQPTKGLEPNRVLQEIMGLESLRDVETQEKMNQLRDYLTTEKFDSLEAKALIEELTLDLGRKDPYIMRLQNQLLFLERKRKKQTA